MTMSERRTIVGIFEDRQRADLAVTDLKAAGFRDDQIGVALRPAEGETTSQTLSSETADHSGQGAMAGALAGLGLGALAGLGVLAGVIPVVGPAIVGGTLGVILSNAAVGAGVAGLAGALIGAGVPEEEARFAHQEFEAGRTIVTVQADGRAAEARAILQARGAYDLSSRPGRATASSATTTTATGAPARTASPAGETIEVHEQRLRAETRPVQTGEVRVRKEVHTETKHLEVPVQHEEVIVERTPVAERPAPAGSTGRTLGPGEELRIPVRQEQVHVHKEDVVTEEVTVGKRVVQETEQVSGQVRKEDVRVEPTGDVEVRGPKGTATPGRSRGPGRADRSGPGSTGGTPG